MGLLSDLNKANSEYLDKEELANNQDLLTLTAIEQKASSFDPSEMQWIVSLTVESQFTPEGENIKGKISFGGKTPSRNRVLKALQQEIEKNGEYAGVVLKVLPPKSPMQQPFFFLDDYQGPVDAIESNNIRMIG